jgi:hypothetical protein
VQKKTRSAGTGPSLGRRPNEGPLILAIFKRRDNSQKFEQALRRPLIVGL